MRRLLTYTLILTLSFGLFSFLSIQLGNQHNLDPFQALGLSQCGDDLCIDGLQPATTLWTTTHAMLSSQANVEVEPDRAIKRKSGLEVHFSRDISDRTTVELRATTRFGLLQLHDLIDTFGAPCAFTLRYEAAIYLEYPLFIAIIVSKPYTPVAMIAPYTPIHNIEISPRKNTCSPILDSPYDVNPSFTWCGFASFDYYLSHCLKPD